MLMGTGALVPIRWIERPAEGSSWSDVTVYVSRTVRFSDLGFSFIVCPSEEVAFERHGFVYWMPSVYPFYLT